MNWLKQYVDVDITAEELADKLTRAGIAVEDVESPGENIDEKIVIGEITDIKPHPDADKLIICQVQVSAEESVQIVTGANNVNVGNKVPISLVGAKLPGGLKIKKAKLRGEVSTGMMCSVGELELDENTFSKEQREGILIMPDSAEVGQKFTEAMGLDDEILVLELTPNRADCLSMINVAREVAAVTGGTLKLPQIEIAEEAEKVEDVAAVEIESPDLCRRYAARVIRGIEIKPSPQWMQQRLRSAGVRPINNVVDATNYVMVEMGQPLHAFDLESVQDSKIVVRLAKAEEKLVTLDEVERQLDEEMLVIADPQKAIGMAGVMGGFNSEVTDTTKDVILESAYFDGTNVRKTARKLGLRSEASHRFEKGINIEGVVTALDRATQLIQELAHGKVASGVLDNYPKKAEGKTVTLRVQRANQLLGTNISSEEIQDIFSRLGFEFNLNEAGDIVVAVPDYRNDIEMEVDLIEEVARLYGYDNIETSLPRGEVTRGSKKFHQRMEDLVKQNFTGSGLTEVITYSFISPKAFDKCMISQDSQLRQVVKVYNPLSEEQSVMRTSIISNLLEVTAKNINKRVENVAIFELGKVYWPTDELLPEEISTLSGLVSGKAEKGWDWSEAGWDFFYLKGILERLFDSLKVSRISFDPVKDNPTFHPGRTAKILAEGKPVGILGEVHPDVLESYDIKQKCIVFEINFDLIVSLASEDVRYKPLAKYPAVDRDLAFVVKEEIKSSQLADVIADAGGSLLKKVTLFDVYQGKQIKDGYKSLAYNMVYQADDRTLTDDEVNKTHDKVREALSNAFDVEFRQ